MSDFVWEKNLMFESQIEWLTCLNVMLEDLMLQIQNKHDFAAQLCLKGNRFTLNIKVCVQTIISCFWRIKVFWLSCKELRFCVTLIITQFKLKQNHDSGIRQENKKFPDKQAKGQNCRGRQLEWSKCKLSDTRGMSGDN